MPKMSDVSLQWNPDAAADKIADVVTEALWLFGQDTLKEATPMVPLDTGTLRRSGTVSVELPNPEEAYSRAKSKTQKTADEVSARNVRGKNPALYVSYNTPYAVWLHETNTWKPRAWKRTAGGKIREKPAVGEWKWLEKALAITKTRLNRYIMRAKRKKGIT